MIYSKFKHYVCAPSDENVLKDLVERIHHRCVSERKEQSRRRQREEEADDLSAPESLTSGSPLSYS